MISTNFPALDELPLADKQALAGVVLRQPLVWVGGKAQCVCPGRAAHTKPDADTDCFVYVEPGAPNVDCFHSACTSTRALLTHDLQSIIGKARVAFNRPKALAASSAHGAGSPTILTRRKSTVAAFDPAKLEAIAAKMDGLDEAWFAARSPKCVTNRTPASFLHELYLPGEKVVVFDNFKSQGQALWEHRGVPFDAGELDSFRKGALEGVWFLCNPVNGEYAETERGPSRRSFRTVTSWRYLVLESDKADPAQWLAVLAQMPLAIVAIYTSGGRSTHALVRVAATSKAHWDAIAAELKPTVIPFGADPGAISAVRLTRLPCCRREEKGALQRLIYLNGHPRPVPIAELPVIAPGWADWQPADQDGFNAGGEL